MADAPRYDCNRKADGKPSANGGYTFAVSSLAGTGTLAVAILPVNSTDRVVFNRPLGDSLSVEPGTSSTESSSGTSTVTPVGSTDTGTVEPSSGGLSAVTTPSSSFSTAAPDTSAPAPKFVGEVLEWVQS